MNYKIFIAIVLASVGVSVYGQHNTDGEIDSLALDKSIRYGRLENGFTYYIKNMEKPQSNLKLRFYVKVGRHNQQKHELNFAHAIEHLAFRATKNFPKGFRNDIEVSYSNIRGSTGATYTEYILDSPNNTEAIEPALRWFRGISTGIIFSKKNVNLERGALLQEHAGSDANRDEINLEKTIYAALFPCKQRYDHFKRHNMTFPEENLQRFYEKWYHPRLMAVSVVGNIADVDKLEKKIKSTFSSIEGSGSTWSSPSCDLSYYNSPPGFAVEKRRADSIPSLAEKPVEISTFFRDPLIPADLKTWRGKKRIIMGGLIAEVLSNRFEDKSRKYNNSYKVFVGHTYKLHKSPNALKVKINAKKGMEQEALRETFEMVSQFKSFGVTKEELQIAKQDFLRNLQSANPEKSSYWEEQIREHFVRGELLPNKKLDFIKNWVEQLSISELNLVVEEIFSKVPEDIGIILPENYASPLASEERFRNLIQKSYDKPVQEYETPEIPSELLSSEKLVTLHEKTPLEITENSSEGYEYLLNNGVKLILKPVSSSGEDNILLHGFSSNGAYCFPEDHYFSAVFAPGIIKNAGVGDFNKFKLEKFLRNTSSLEMGLSPYVLYNETGVKGTVSIDEFENLLQLVYLYFSEPRKDKSAFQDWKSGQFKYALNNNAMNDFFDERMEINKDLSILPMATAKIQGVKAVEFHKAYEIYRQLFRNAQDFTFVITGNFDIPSVLPKAQKYLGNLPNSGSVPFCTEKEWGVARLPKGPIYKEISTPNHYTTDNSFYGFTFIRPKEDNHSWKEEIKVEALAAVTNTIVKGLRTDGFSLYWFGVGGKYNRHMNRYEIGFSFTGIPDEQPLIKKRTQEIISDLKAGKFSKGIWEDARESLLQRFNSDYLKSANRVHDRLYKHYRFDEPLVDPSKVEGFIRSLTIEDLAETARAYYKDELLYELLMKEKISD